MTAHTTHFPGAAYETYLWHAVERARPQMGPSGSAVRGGIKKFIDPGDWPDDYLDRKVPGWEEYVSVDAGDENTCVRKFSDKSKQPEICGLWKIKDGDIGDLEEKCEKYDRVYIHLDCTNRHLQNGWKTYLKLKLRAMYDLQNIHRDRLKMIPFGIFMFQIYYEIGMSGGGINCRDYFEQSINIPTTGRDRYKIRKDWGVWKTYADRWKGEPDRVKSFRLLALRPVLVKSFYEYQEDIDIDKLLRKYEYPDYNNFYFCRNFRDLDFSKDVNNRNRSIKGNTSIRPDQHVFLKNDGISCDKCSLSYCCRLYREGGVCLVPSTEGGKLAKKFKSNKVSDIISGIQDVIGMQADLTETTLAQYKKAIEEETEPPKLDPNKMLNDLIRNGAALAKLKDPTLMKPKVQVNVNGLPEGGKPGVIDGEVVDPVAQIEAMTDREKASIVRRMEGAGFKREHITMTMIAEFFAAEQTGDTKAIEAKKEEMDIF